MARRSTVRGAAKLRRQLRALPDAVKAGVLEAMAEAAAKVHADALATLAASPHPYSTGELRNRFRVFISKDGLQARVGSWGRRRARHIHLVEFGAAPHDIPAPKGGVIQHPGAPAQPFLGPAYMRHRADSLRRIRAAVRRALAASGGKDGRR